MGELSPWHWAIVIVIAMVLFGAKRMPDAARSLGRSARILRAELRGEQPPTPVTAQVPADGPANGSAHGPVDGPAPDASAQPPAAAPGPVAAAPPAP